jgi:hypothetical protein
VEIIFELLFELLFQIVAQVLLEFGVHAVAEPFHKKPNPLVAALGCVLVGLVVGGISLGVFPSYLLKAPGWQWVNLAATPIVAGICAALLGWWRMRKGQSVLRIDTFSYGYLFALTVALVRFTWAN